MPIQKMGPRKFRATVKHPATGQRVSVASVLGTGYGQSSYENKTDARKAIVKALDILNAELVSDEAITLATFWDRWTRHPIFQRPKESTNIHNHERTQGFVERYGDRLLTEIDHNIVQDWLSDSSKLSTVPALRAMFNDAQSSKGGYLVVRNPFAKLGLSRGDGRTYEEPPTEAMVWKMIEAARRLVSPGFAAYIQLAAFGGIRPGELNALKWDDIDFDDGWIRIDEQMGARARKLTTPKNGKTRLVPMHAESREALLSLSREHKYVLVNLHGNPWTAQAVHGHWVTVRDDVGWDKSFYLATRHFAGWLMYEQLGQDADDVGRALGHTGKDPGKLVRTTYGHRNDRAAMERIKAAVAGRDGGQRGLRVA